MVDQDIDMNIDIEEVGLEVPAADGNPRRIIVDVSNPNRQLPSSKKPQVPQENDKKAKVMKFIAFSHKKILEAFFKKPDYMDLSVGDQVHNILFTCYTMLRQHHNGTGGTLEARIAGTDFKITYNGQEKTVPKDPIKEIVASEAILQGIPFARYENRDPKNWYGIANPLLNFLSGYALRRKELRLGHHVMPIEKRNNQEKDVTLSQYGIYGVHHPLCEGVSFPPEKRSSMPQSLGPMTSLLCYMKSERRYIKKWSDAVKRDFAHFPEIDAVMSVLKEKDPAEVRSLMTLIGDVALIASTRQAQRMFPPPAAFSLIFTTAQHKVGNSTYATETLFPGFNFSGHGAFAFYKIFMSKKWRMNLNAGTDSIAKQICYHSMFGTYKEDFGILSQITNFTSWNTREEMGTVFKKVNTDGTSLEFEPVKQKLYSKLSQANMTGLLTTASNQLTSVPVFAGRSKRKYGDAFLDYLVEEKSKASGGRSLQALITTYSTLKGELTNMLESKSGMLDVGTVGWKKIEDVTPTLEGYPDEEIRIVANGRFFLGKN
uniref:Nucleoprotein n=1 Tax=Hymenopteran orthomyxo-related virus OKIAV174 TaxID=2792558 RepID=A0A7T0M3C9_9ORTO|nr:nucleoprotein [Hymenopteran orthomyxo-related virus OKIAV174]